MVPTRLALLALLPILTSACVVTRTQSRTWGDPYGYGAQYGQEWERPGRVTAIRETITQQRGDPAAGAVAGAVVGGLLGHAIGGPRSGGGLVGAVGGAMVGAAASQGGVEERYYELFIRYDDGGTETVVYRGYPPFRVGDWVVQTPRGLQAHR